MPDPLPWWQIVERVPELAFEFVMGTPIHLAYDRERSAWDWVANSTPVHFVHDDVAHALCCYRAHDWLIQQGYIIFDAVDSGYRTIERIGEHGITVSHINPDTAYRLAVMRVAGLEVEA